jgi:hypothetical protein
MARGQGSMEDVVPISFDSLQNIELITWRHADVHCPHAPTIFTRCPPLQLSAIGTMALISQRYNSQRCTCDLFENLDKMEPARIPND